MRLTLRTLLAYLDDTLEPAEARSMGQKVAESPAAQDLITRIRNLSRRRPEPAEAGARFDANLVADYLDNALPPEKVAEVEEACLASEAHLAEVAACHQILTLVLGEPVQVPPLAKERMYDLVRDPHQAVRRPARTEIPTEGHHDEADEMLLMGLPGHLGHGAVRRWLVPAGVIVLLLAVLGGAVYFSVASLFVRHSQNPPNPALPPVGPEPVALGPGTNQVKPEENKAAHGANAEGNAEDKRPVENKPEVKKPAEGANAEGKGEEKKPDEKKVADRRPKKNPPSKERRPAGEFVSADSILLRRGPDLQWQRVRRGSPVFTSEHLVSLPGYRSEVRPETPVRLGLWGSLPEDQRSRAVLLESAVVLHADPSVDLDFTLDRGRVAVSNHKEKGPAHVRIRFHGDEIWEITLQTTDTEVGLEYWGADPLDFGLGKDPRGEGPMAVLGLFILKGEANLRVENEEYAMPAQSRYVWDSVHGPSHRVEALRELPDWARRYGGPPLQARARQALEGLSRTLTGKDVDVALASTLQSADPVSRILAIFCLGAVSDLPNLLDALADDKHPEVRGTGAFVLKYWLNLKAENAAELKRALDRKGFTADQAETVIQLLHPFPLAAVNQPATYEALIAYLRNEKLAIRELAGEQLQALAPVEAKDIPYDPAGDSDGRDKAVTLWKKRIPDGKLPARPGVPPTK